MRCNMGNFVYVFSQEDKQRLINAGYLLLKEDVKNNVYTFKATDTMRYALDTLDEYTVSDTLTF